MSSNAILNESLQKLEEEDESDNKFPIISPETKLSSSYESEQSGQPLI